jgi:xanthine dehydrogenase accessory factor
MLIVGAVHVAQSLAAMARLNGFEVVIVDPRAAFATAERFPAVTLCLDWPDQALQRLKPDRRTAIVTLTHDPKLDDPALVIAARSPAFYVGALGSRRSHARRLERLATFGLLPHEQASIKAPVGLGIGAITTAEIATSIMAEVIQELRRETRTQ